MKKRFDGISIYKKRRHGGNMSFRRKWLVIGASVIGLILVLSLLGNVKNNPIRSALGVVTQPIERLFRNISLSATANRDTGKREDQLRNENALLRNQVAQLQLEIDTIHESKLEAERLAKLAQFALGNPEMRFTPARVIAKQPSDWFTVFRIDKGKQQGIRVGATVCNSQGLVGHVTQVGDSWAIVMGLIDGRSGVACFIERTRENCFLEGAMENAGQNRPLSVKYLSSTADVQPGDRLLSSGLDQMFPKGLVVGKIVAVNPAKENRAREVNALPVVDFSRIETVLVTISQGG